MVNSLGVIQDVHWSARALTDQFRPTTRHDLSAWRESDSVRALVAGTLFAMRVVIIQVKGDCMKLCEMFGYPNRGRG